MPDPRPEPSGPEPSGGDTERPPEAYPDPTIADVPYVSDGAHDADLAAAAGPTFACPACGGTVPADEIPADGLLACPACGAEFFATTESSDEDRDLAERMEADQRRREQELDNVRIRQVLTERRSLFRTRSYFVVLAGIALVAAAQFGIFAVQRVRGPGFGPRAAVYLAAVAALLWAAWACVGRIRFYNRELARPVLEDPVAEPDFSTLSDGSQRLDEAAANLDRLSGRG